MGVSAFCCLSRALAALGVFVIVDATRRLPMSEEDPNSQFLCEGSFAGITACQCRDDESELVCINAQFTDTSVFLKVNNYSRLRKVTFHGNNFQDLPEVSLFGQVEHPNLEVLNMSANYVVNLHSQPLKGMPNLLVLDLSNNEIVLKNDDLNFLSHTPRLRQLYLRRAFTSVVNRTVQFSLLMEMFRRAKLNELNYIDLSYNYLTSVPFDIACPFPSLRYLDLRQNFLQSLSVNTTCLKRIETLDLSRNHFWQLDKAFMGGVGSALPPDSILIRNSFHCDCESPEYISWIRASRTIRDKDVLTCQRASPAVYMGARLVEVPLGKLNCTAPVVDRGSSESASYVILCLLLFSRIFLL